MESDVDDFLTQAVDARGDVSMDTEVDDFLQSSVEACLDSGPHNPRKRNLDAIYEESDSDLDLSDDNAHGQSESFELERIVEHRDGKVSSQRYRVVYRDSLLLVWHAVESKVERLSKHTQFMALPREFVRQFSF